MKTRILGMLGGVLGALLAYAAIDVARTWAAADGDQATEHLTLVIPFNGRLDWNGAPYDGDLAMRFQLYDAGGNYLGWQEFWSGASNAAPLVKVRDGRFSVLLGKSTGELGAIVAGAEEIYVGVSVREPGATSGYVGMVGTQRLTTAPYALLTMQGASLDVDSLTVGSATAAASISLVADEDDGDAFAVGGDVTVEGPDAKLAVGIQSAAGQPTTMTFAFGDDGGDATNGAQLRYGTSAGDWRFERGNGGGEETAVMTLSAAGDVAIDGTMTVGGVARFDGDLVIPDGGDVIVEGTDPVFIGQGTNDIKMLQLDGGGEGAQLRYDPAFGVLFARLEGTTVPSVGFYNGLESSDRGMAINGDLTLGGDLDLVELNLDGMTASNPEDNDADKVWVGASGCDIGAVVVTILDGQPALCVCHTDSSHSGTGRGWYCLS